MKDEHANIHSTLFCSDFLLENRTRFYLNHPLIPKVLVFSIKMTTRSHKRKAEEELVSQDLEIPIA